MQHLVYIYFILILLTDKMPGNFYIVTTRVNNKGFNVRKHQLILIFTNSVLQYSWSTQIIVGKLLCLNHIFSVFHSDCCLTTTALYYTAKLASISLLFPGLYSDSSVMSLIHRYSLICI